MEQRVFIILSLFFTIILFSCKNDNMGSSNEQSSDTIIIDVEDDSIGYDSTIVTRIVHSEVVDE